MLNHSPHRLQTATELRPNAGDPRTSASRRAGCEAHKSGSVRGAPGRLGVPTRRGRLREALTGGGYRRETGKGKQVSR